MMACQCGLTLEMSDCKRIWYWHTKSQISTNISQDWTTKTPSKVCFIHMALAKF